MQIAGRRNQYGYNLHGCITRFRDYCRYRTFPNPVIVRVVSVPPYVCTLYLEVGAAVSISQPRNFQLVMKSVSDRATVLFVLFSILEWTSLTFAN